MRRCKVFGLVLMSVFVVGVMMAASAFAESSPLPLIHTALPGEIYPLALGGKVTSAGIKLANTHSSLPATEVSILLLVNELTALGPATIVFLGVEEPIDKETCTTAGAKVAGEVVVPDAEFHMVYTSLSPGKTLETAGLILFSKFIISCGPVGEALETVTTGPSMSRLSEVPGNSTNGGDSTQIESATHCSNITNGVQEVLSYFTDSSIELKEQLLLASISGTPTAPSCEEIPGTLLLGVETGSKASMFTVLL